MVISFHKFRKKVGKPSFPQIIERDENVSL